MRLIDADALKEKLIKIQNDIANEKVSRGSAISDAWKPAYLLILDEYIKMIDEMPSATQHYDCDALHDKGCLIGEKETLKEYQHTEGYKND